MERLNGEAAESICFSPPVVAGSGYRAPDVKRALEPMGGAVSLGLISMRPAAPESWFFGTLGMGLDTLPPALLERVEGLSAHIDYVPSSIMNAASSAAADKASRTFFRAYVSGGYSIFRLVARDTSQGLFLPEQGDFFCVQE